MGYAIARAALEAGARVTLVTGPVALALPAAPPRSGGRLRVLRVETARQMRAAALPAFRSCDVAFHVAAVADFRPARVVRGKIKKSAPPRAASGRIALDLVPNPDILAECGRRKRPGQVLVGFALEASRGERNARAKLRAKNLDLVVLNGPSALNAAHAEVTVLAREGDRRSMRAPKHRIARTLVRLAFDRWLRQSRATKRPPR